MITGNSRLNSQVNRINSITKRRGRTLIGGITCGRDLVLPDNSDSYGGSILCIPECGRWSPFHEDLIIRIEEFHALYLLLFRVILHFPLKSLESRTFTTGKSNWKFNNNSIFFSL